MGAFLHRIDDPHRRRQREDGGEGEAAPRAATAAGGFHRRESTPSPRRFAARARRLASGLALLFSALLAAACSRAREERPASPSPRPNLLVIVADDLGFGDVGVQGAKDVRTPVLDRLAREGVRLTDGYAAAPVCTPTRAALMTGRWPARCGLEGPIPVGLTGPGLEPRPKTLPRRLREAGYRTAMFGKWHLGYRFRHGPEAHGFETFFGCRGGILDYWTHRDPAGTKDLWRNGERVDVEGYLTDLVADRAAAWIRARARDGDRRPWFCYVPFTAPHFPYQDPDEPSEVGSLDEMVQGSRAAYVKMVERLDACIGRILRAVDASGQREDTFVLFFSDNGGDTFGRNAPLRAGKASLWEGGVRTVTMVRWPGHLPEGRVCRQPSVTCDWTATFYALAGVKVDDVGLDGIDLLPFLAGEKEPRERAFFWRMERADRFQRAARVGRYKWIYTSEHEELYDLEDDIGEKRDLAAEKPDVLARLRRAYDAWAEEMARENPPYRLH